MNKKNITLTIILLFVTIFLIYFINDSVKNGIEKNKKRLIEVSILRENLFWDCFDKKIEEETAKWKSSSEYLIQNEKYNICINSEVNKQMNEYNNLNSAYKQYLFSEENGKPSTLLMKLKAIGNCPGPIRPWQLHNEIASKYCSESVDNTQEGILVKKLRKKVPIEALTSYELNKIINESRLK